MRKLSPTPLISALALVSLGMAVEAQVRSPSPQGSSVVVTQAPLGTRPTGLDSFRVRTAPRAQAAPVPPATAPQRSRPPENVTTVLSPTDTRADVNTTTTAGTTAGQTSDTGTGSTSAGATGTAAFALPNVFGVPTFTNRDGRTIQVISADGSGTVTIDRAGVLFDNFSAAQSATARTTTTTGVASNGGFNTNGNGGSNGHSGFNGNGNGNGNGDSMGRVAVLRDSELDREARELARRTKQKVARGGQMLHTIAPRTNQDRTDQMPDDPLTGAMTTDRKLIGF